MQNIPKDKSELSDHSAYSNEQFFRRQREARQENLPQQNIWDEEPPYDWHGDAGNPLIFSNFLITISTNVVPIDELEHGAVSQWLTDECHNLFDDWTMLNGTVLKPAGAPNGRNAAFPANHLIEGVRSRITLERGAQRGQVHAHVVLEVAHRYRERNEFNLRGVHCNSGAMREYLSSRIHLMEIDKDRQPNSIYVNCRLITTRNNQQAKWLTLQYIGKDSDRFGTNLARQRALGTAEERSIEAGLRHPDLEFAPMDWRNDNNIGLGGALVDDNTQQDPPMQPPPMQYDDGGWNQNESVGDVPEHSQSLSSQSSQVSSSWNPARGDLPMNVTWASAAAKRSYYRKKK
jgi:hypothetical protein